MTAEVAVMNQYGVALAADSAVTVRGERGPKIFSSADKIFTLSRHETVGIMVYGTASTMNVPWETIIKVYRNQLGATAFPTLEDYATDFFGFLERNDLLFPPEQKGFFVYRTACSIYEHVRDRIKAAIDDATANGPVSQAVARRTALTAIRQQHKAFMAMPDRGGLPQSLRARLVRTYGGELAQARKDVFGTYPFTATAGKQLRELALCALLKEPIAGDSGVVIAGFGQEDVFPRLVSYEFDGVVLDHAVYWARGNHAITHFDHAFVQGFAQSDMVHLFMEGVTQEYETFVESYVRQIVEQLGSVVAAKMPSGTVTPTIEAALRADQTKLLADMQDEFAERRTQLYVDPVLSVVGSLPKDELGALAESLVNLTSLKRRISMDNETVGGPIDVAVMTKGDGFVWTKRKHYFDPTLNHHFFANYFRDRSHDKTP